MSLLYFNAVDGEMLTTFSFEKTLHSGAFTKDSVVTTNNGNKIFYVLLRPVQKSAVIGAVGFDLANAVTPWSNKGYHNRLAYDQDIDK